MLAIMYGVAGVLAAGCQVGASDRKAEAPPPLKLKRVEDRDVFEVERLERFRLERATSHTATSELRVTGTVNPDISRNVPVISLASGRVVEIHARIGDVVTKGQLLLRVQSSDISSAYSDYQQAVADSALAGKQLERSRRLYDHGAIALKELEVAVATADKAAVTVRTTTERLRVLGVDPDHPSPVVDIKAPIAGVITDQQVTNAAGVTALGQNPFTISDLTRLWIVCDVFENDLAHVHLGEPADIRLNAYPDQRVTGTISNITPILDPNIRTAKVRVEVRNPGLMLPGMFVTATFHGRQETRAVVRAEAILHLHDRDWVFMQIHGNKFRRVEVRGGDMLPGGLQEVRSGLSAGQPVVANALEFESAVQH
jgi:cobalt-zinc-cadmium efflux system membrane fusion protein